MTLDLRLAETGSETSCYVGYSVQSTHQQTLCAPTALH